MYVKGEMAHLRYMIYLQHFFQILQLLVLSQHFIADTCDLYISFDFYLVMKSILGAFKI